MRLRAVILTVTAAIIGFALAVAPAAAAQAKPNEKSDFSITKRALTDADIDRYCLITQEIRRLGIPKNTAADLRRHADEANNIKGKHDWSALEYGTVDARISTVLLLIQFEGKMPVPAEKKADYELVKKHAARIKEARKVLR